jgi:molybdopterin synthase sulfur carrier subunit
MARVLLFGRLSDLAGWRERVIEPAPASLAALRQAIAALDPALGAALAGAGVQAAVNRTLVRGDIALAPGAEVAFMPPMSGG